MLLLTRCRRAKFWRRMKAQEGHPSGGLEAFLVTPLPKGFALCIDIRLVVAAPPRTSRTLPWAAMFVSRSTPSHRPHTARDALNIPAVDRSGSSGRSEQGEQERPPWGKVTSISIGLTRPSSSLGPEGQAVAFPYVLVPGGSSETKLIVDSGQASQASRASHDSPA